MKALTSLWQTQRTKVVAGVAAIVVILGCGGGTPYSPMVVAPAGSFRIAATPPSRTIAPGASTTFDVTLTPIEGASAPEGADLSVSGLPQGATGTIPTTATIPDEVVLSISTTGAVAPGTYPITITGRNGDESHAASVNLIITGSLADFTITVSPKEATIGEPVATGARASAFREKGFSEVPPPSASFAITITPLNGFTGRVNLSTVGLNDFREGGARVFDAQIQGENFVDFATGDPAKDKTLVVEQVGPTDNARVPFTVNGVGGGKTHSDNAAVLVPQDFNLLNSGPQSIIPGGTGSYQVDVTGQQGGGTVHLAFTSNPLDGSSTFIDVPNVAVGGGSPVRIETSSTVTPGSYNYTVTGTRGAVTRTTTLVLNVGAPFTITITPPTQSMPNGSNFLDSITGVDGISVPSVEYRVTVTPTGADFRGVVDITSSGLEGVLQGGQPVFSTSLGFTTIDFGSVQFNNKPVEFDLDVTRVRPTFNKGTFPFEVEGKVSGGLFKDSASAAVVLTDPQPQGAIGN